MIDDLKEIADDIATAYEALPIQARPDYSKCVTNS